MITFLRDGIAVLLVGSALILSYLSSGFMWCAIRTMRLAQIVAVTVVRQINEVGNSEEVQG